MFGDGDAPRAWGYTWGAARVLGVNLTDAVVEGWLSRTELAQMVETCARCAATGQCTEWLARTVAATELPGFCPNKQMLEGLRL